MSSSDFSCTYNGSKICFVFCCKCWTCNNATCFIFSCSRHEKIASNLSDFHFHRSAYIWVICLGYNVFNSLAMRCNFYMFSKKQKTFYCICCNYRNSINRFIWRSDNLYWNYIFWKGKMVLFLCKIYIRLIFLYSAHCM